MDESLRKYATDKQWSHYVALCQHGSQRSAANALGVTKSLIGQSVKAIMKKAARHEYHDGEQHRQAPEGFSIQGISEYKNGTWLKMNRDKEAMQEALEAFVDGLCDTVEPAKPVKSPFHAADKDLMSIYVLGDAHLGMRATAKETGRHNFDVKIATKDIRTAVDYLIDRSPKSEVGVLLNVGDLFHADDPSARTPESGHMLDVDGRHTDVVKAARDVITYAVDHMLRKHKRVMIINAKGNHDKNAAEYINIILETHYRKEKRVEVVPNRTKFIYWKHGDVLMGCHHGDKIKFERMYEAMTRDKREDYGKAKRCYFYCGHWHHQQAKEIGGCKFETFSTLAPPDKWHADGGYGAARMMTCIIMSKRGELSRNIFDLDMV